MLTDLRLQKYLQGMLSAAESKEVEALVENSPEMKARLEALKAQSEVLGKPMWQRVLLGRQNRLGSRTRSTILLPLLLVVAVILMLSGHWFSKPGENSTFTLAGGNGAALELLYNAQSGWRYLDAGFRGGDSLTFSIRDNGSYHVSIHSVFGRGKDAEVVPLVTDGPENRFEKNSPKPTFLAGDAEQGRRPSQIIVFYDDTPLPDLPAARVLDILETKGNERGGMDFQYQVFSSGP